MHNLLLSKVAGGSLSNIYQDRITKYAVILLVGRYVCLSVDSLIRLDVQYLYNTTLC